MTVRTRLSRLSWTTLVAALLISAFSIGGLGDAWRREGEKGFTWDIPELELETSPLVVLNESFDWNYEGSFAPPLKNPFAKEIEAALEYIQGLPTPPCTAPFIPNSFDLSVGVDIEFDASMYLMLHPLSEANSGAVHTDGLVDVEATVSKITMARGESAFLKAKAIMTRSRTVDEAVVDGGGFIFKGSLAASATATLLGNRFTMTPFQDEVAGSDPYSFEFEVTPETGLQEFEGTGISFGVYRRTLGANTSSVGYFGPVYRINGDLDKIALLLISKRGRTSKVRQRASGVLKACDDGLGATWSDGSGNELTLHLADCELDLTAGARRWIEEENPKLYVHYAFSAPVEIAGELVSELTVERNLGTSIRRAAGTDGVVPEEDGPLTIVSAQQWFKTTDFTIPVTCKANTIEVTPTFEIVFSTTQALAFNFHAEITRELGIVGARVENLTIWKGWNVCGVKWPVPCIKECCVNLWFREVCSPCPGLCKKSKFIGPWKLVDFGFGPWTAYEDSPIEKSWNLASSSRTDTYEIEIPLEPFTIEVLRPPPLRLVQIRSTGEAWTGCSRETGCRREEYCVPGDTVHVAFSGPEGMREYDWKPVAAWINGREAELSGDGYGASRVLDEQDPDGPVEFLIEYVVCQRKAVSPGAYYCAGWMPGAAWETTSNYCCVWNASRPPSAPELLEPADGANLSRAPQALRWARAYDSSGREAERYEITGSIETLDGEIIPFDYEATHCRTSYPAFFRRDPPLAIPNGSSVTWRVRAADQRGRWGPYSETNSFCYMPEARFTSASIGSSSQLNSAYALKGDEATATFSTDVPLQIPPMVEINGRPAEVVGDGTTWAATHTLTASDPVGPVQFRIECLRVLPSCCGGETLVSETSTTTDGSSVILIEPLDPPMLIYPDDGARITIGSTVRSFSWVAHDVAGWLDPALIELEMTVERADGSTDVVVEHVRGLSFLTRSTSDLGAGSTVTWRVRAQDHLGRWGSFSDPRTIYLFEELLVEINQDEWQLDPTNEDWIRFAVAFSRDDYIPDFDPSDVVLGGTAGASIVEMMWEPSFGIRVGGMTRPGTVIASIPAGAFHTEDGTPNTASTSVDNVVTFDNTPPMASVSQELIADADAGGRFAVRIDYPFEMDTSMSPWVWFDPNIVASGTLSFATEAWSEGDTAYTATYTMMDVGESAAGVDVWGGGALSGSSLWLEPHSPALADAFSIDTENPTAVVAASAEEASGTSIEFSAAFSEAVDGLEVPDIIVTNGTVASLEGSDGMAFTITVAPEREGDVTLRIPAGAATDLAGNGSEASNVATLRYVLPAELVEISIDTSTDSWPFCTIGDVVMVTFTADKKLSGLPKVETGRCDADVTYQGSNTYVAACVMDDSTREGEIEFEIRGEDRFGNPVVGTETTDGSEVVFDSEPPGFDDCPDDVTTTDAEVDWDEPTAWDNGSGVASLTQTHDPGDTFPVGTTTVVYTATDNAWNTATCAFDVTVIDDEPPGFDDCPGDISTTTSTDSAVVTWTEPTAFDHGSGIASVTQTHDPGDTFPLGATTVTYTATDNAGNTATCEFDVTVIDDEPPGFDNCPGDTWEGTSTTSAIVTWDEPTAYDHGSGIASVTQTHHPGDTFPLGTTTVIYTATDNAGNTATCEFDVTVKELL